MDLTAQDFFALQLWLINNYAIISANVIWIIDFVATLPTEVEVIWSSRLTACSFVFLLNRYAYLVHIFFQVMTTLTTGASLSDRTCAAFGYAQEMSVIIAIATTGVLISQRVYAICGRKRSIVWISATCIGIRLGLDIYVGIIQQKSLSTAETKYSAYSRCMFENPNPTWYAACLQLVVPAVAIAFDIFVVTMTLKKCTRHFFEMRKVRQFSLTQLLLRDGLLYFFVMLAIGLISAGTGIISLAVGGNLSPGKSAFFHITVPFFDALPNILIARLVLNLRTCACAQNHGHTTRLGSTVPRTADLEFVQSVASPNRMERSQAWAPESNYSTTV